MGRHSRLPRGLHVGAINSYRTTPLYQASTQILIEKDTPKVGDLSTIFQQSDGWYNDDFYQTQYRILQSRSLARKTAETMKLEQHPAASPRAGGAGAVDAPRRRRRVRSGS